MRLLRGYGADGVLFAGGGLTDRTYLREVRSMLRQMRECGTAVIALGHLLLAVPEVNIDNQAAIGDVVAHLVALGHRRIAFIGGLPAVTTSDQRLTAYRLAIAAAGLVADPDLVLPGDYTYDGGRSAAELLLTLDPRPTAVLAVNDASAIGCLAVPKERGINLPAGMSVAGFNDITAAQFVDPSLTTVSVPMYELGATGMRQLLRSLAGESIEPFYRLPHRLVVRHSICEAKEEGP